VAAANKRACLEAGDRASFDAGKRRQDLVFEVGDRWNCGLEKSAQDDAGRGTDPTAQAWRL